MGLLEQINNDAMTARKEKDVLRLNILNGVKTSVSTLVKSKHAGYEPTDVEILNIISKTVKANEDVAETFAKQGHEDLAKKELAEAQILKAYLPKPLSTEELKVIIEETIKSLGATTMKDMGNVMREVQSKVGGKGDGKTISTIVKSMLS